MLHECLARVPELGLHLCRHCAEKDEWLNVAFGNDANEFAESASDMKFPNISRGPSRGLLASTSGACTTEHELRLITNRC